MEILSEEWNSWAFAPVSDEESEAFFRALIQRLGLSSEEFETVIYEALIQRLEIKTHDLREDSQATDTLVRTSLAQLGEWVLCFNAHTDGARRPYRARVQAWSEAYRHLWHPSSDDTVLINPTTWNACAFAHYGALFSGYIEGRPSSPEESVQLERLRDFSRQQRKRFNELR